MTASSNAAASYDTPIPTTAHDPGIEAFHYKYSSFDDVLDDLSSRFIINLPESELHSLERIFFQVEQAHWFYEDYIRESNMQYPSLPLKKFSELLFRSCPLLNRWSADHDAAFEQWQQYKIRVPVCGAIMLNAACDKCVLVKGWKPSSGWGFPKGKINEQEPPLQCAIREVLEETGYDISRQIHADDVITMTIRDQHVSLYLVPGVPEDFPFQTRTKKEISKIEWFRLVDLPTWKRNREVPGKFYLIAPFMGPLKAFVYDRRPGRKHKPPPHHRSASSVQRMREQNGLSSIPVSPAHIEALPDMTITVERAENNLDIGAMDTHLASLLGRLSASAGTQTNGYHEPTPEFTATSRPNSTVPSGSSASASPYLDYSSVTSYESGTSSNGRVPSRIVTDHVHTRPHLPQSMTRESADPAHGYITPHSAGLSSNTSSSGVSPASLPSQTAVNSASSDDSERRRKQLALLDHMAEESQVAMSRSTTVMGVHGPLPYPGPPASVPPPASAMDGAQSWTGPPYTGSMGGPLFPRSATMSRGPYAPPVYGFGPLYTEPHDPFQVRPRTSVAMRPAYPLHAAGRSMHEAQLQSFMRVGMPPISESAQPPLVDGLHHAPPYPLMNGSTAPSALPAPATRMGPPSPYMMHSHARPLAAPLHPPSLTRGPGLSPMLSSVRPSPAANPGHLLSLLNGP